MATTAYVTSGRLPRQIVPGLVWLGGCSNSAAWPGRENAPAIHEPLSTYLILGSERTLLVDTGHFALWHAVQPQLRRALGGRTLDYVLPSHPELPHAGNLGRLMSLYPEARAVGNMRDYHVYFPEVDRRRFLDLGDGEAVDLGDTSIVLIEPIWRDLTSTMWAYDTARKALFPADGLGYLHHHHADVCGWLGSELPESCSPADERWFANGGAFHWMKYKDMRPSIDTYRNLVRRYPVELVCSAHGAPIDDRVAEFTEAMLRGIANGGIGSSLNAQR